MAVILLLLPASKSVSERFFLKMINLSLQRDNQSKSDLADVQVLIRMIKTSEND